MVSLNMPVITSANRKRPIKVEELPNIPRYLKDDQLHLLLPLGYDDIVSCYVDDTILTNKKLILKFKNAEFKGNDEVVINKSLYNSLEADVETPMFLLETSTLKTGKRYFDKTHKDNKQILNVNQILYLIIQHRLALFARKLAERPDRKIYVSLLRTDINKRLSKFIEWVKPNTHNALTKIENTYAIITNRVHEYGSEKCIGDYLDNNGITEYYWRLIFKDISNYLLPTSETSMSKSNKVTLSASSSVLFRAPGYYYNQANSCFDTIFPSKQNVPARFKTHILSNAVTLQKPQLSNFQQLCHFDNGIVSSLDNTTRQAVVVFHPMDLKSKRFICGESEASSSIAKTEVIVTESFNLDFSVNAEDVYIEQGKTYTPNGEPFVLGLDLDGNEHVLKEYRSIEILELEPNATAGTYYLKVKGVKWAGNARLVSYSGFKGVTKIRPDNGFIVFAPKDRNNKQLTFEEHLSKRKNGEASLGRYIDNKQYDSFTTINTDDLKGCQKLSVDIVTGMNAIKAGENTIVLGQAALAVKLGFYTPTPKGRNGEYKNILNTRDVNEIQAAADSLPPFVYVDANGNAVKCHIGLIDVMYTELGSTYAKFKPQSFSFEAGWVIKQNHPELYDHIFSTYLETDKVEISKELFKILKDENGALRADEQLPIYSIEAIRKKMFNINEDLFRVRTSSFKSRSRLLDEEWNKGFYIDLTKHKGPLIRVPSAKTLNYFINLLPSGEYSYHEILFSISKIILAILGRTEQNMDMNIKDPNPNLYWIFNKTKDSDRTSLYSAYLSNVKGVLYSSPSMSHMFVQSFIKPRIPGFSLKQVVDSLVPNDVILVTNKHLYNRALKQSGFTHIFNPSAEVNHVDVLKLCSEVRDNSSRQSCKELLTEALNDVPLGIFMRNPMLWTSQIMVRKIWSIEHFRAYLNIYHNIDLDTYLDDYFNKDLLIMNPETVLQAKADSDGDLAPVSVLNSTGQKLLKDLVITTIPKEEVEWLKEYALGEFEADEKLKVGEKLSYTVYTISSKFDSTGQKPESYPQYLINSASNKSAIGPATIDGWLIKLLFQMYNALFDKNNGKVLDNNGKVISHMKFKLTNHEINLLSFIYIKLIQSRVVEGIKHYSGGTAGFQMYYLKNITKPEYIDLVKKELEYEFKLNKILISKLLDVIEYANYDNSLLKACQLFVSKYNKGKLPKEPEILDYWESQIQEYTYFGSLVKPLFDIEKRIKELGTQSLYNSLNDMTLLETTNTVNISSVQENPNGGLTLDF